MDFPSAGEGQLVLKYRTRTANLYRKGCLLIYDLQSENLEEIPFSMSCARW